MADPHAAARRAIDKALLAGSEWCPHNLFLHVERAVEQGGNPYDGKVALEYWWTLCRTGVVALLGDKSSGSTPMYLLTERGRAVLKGGASSPYDAKGYIAAITQRVASPDAVVLAYLEEAVASWASGLYRASTVMLGCASERLILILAEDLSAACVEPYSSKLARLLARAGRPAGISEIFDEVEGALQALGEDHKLPLKLADTVGRRITAIFEHARGLRNKAGHPTGAEVSEEDAHAGLLLFPGYYETVAATVNAVRSLSPTAPS